ncbi:MAG: helix-turn-helix domain-containing protein [Candidatus Eremiobacteraeota bacterium]|nr:helix-turn-helix domain-containing protein [Candidatus Eremiobacteraeota bacterium]MCW5871387.1 helix-turn-helix domain-containing protein [Candidatus Eremiobacteraeota bacterium]
MGQSKEHSVHHRGINVSRVRALRRKEQWSQQDLADKLGVHRVTLARWELGEAEPPLEMADKLAEVFQVDRQFFFQVAPFPDLEGAAMPGEITDPWLSRFPLAKLQKFTRPALKVLGFSLRQLARILPDLSVDRIQELLNGQKPTAFEIQMLRNAFGTDFNPTSSIKERILATKSMPYTGNAIEERLSTLENSVHALTMLQMTLLDKVNLLLDRVPAPPKPKKT